MNLNVFQAIVSASGITLSQDAILLRLSRSARAYCYGVVDIDGSFVCRPDFGQEVDSILDILKELGISLKWELSYEMAKKLVIGGYPVRADNDMHPSMGGVDCTVSEVQHLDHFEESNRMGYSLATIHYYL